MSNIEKCDANVDHFAKTRIKGLWRSNSRQCTRNAIENSDFCKVHTDKQYGVIRWSTGKGK